MSYPPRGIEERGLDLLALVATPARLRAVQPLGFVDQCVDQRDQRNQTFAKVAREEHDIAECRIDTRHRGDLRQPGLHLPSIAVETHDDVARQGGRLAVTGQQ
jgi:hypothetical protein